MRDLEMLFGTLGMIARELPERCSVRQLLFFLVAAHMDLSHRTSTLSEIVEFMGDGPNFDEKGRAKPLLGRGIEATYTLFLPPTKRDPNTLGWLTATENPDNRRQKLLRLTDKGREVVAEIVNNTHR
jgi:hypothetical protein